MPARSKSPQSSTDRISNSLDDVAQAVTPKRMGRPPKSKEEKYLPTHIYFHPKIVKWAKAEAEKRGIGYQSVINEALLEMIVH
jgi:hypothetical protein